MAHIRLGAWRAAISIVILSLAGSGCVSVVTESPPASTTPQESTDTANLPDPAQLFPVPPIPDEVDAPPFEETQALTGSLELGTPGDATSATIGAAGGSIETSGLRIDFAPETLPADTALSVSAAPISSIAGFGDAVTPITPLYTVAGADDVTLEQPATVTLAADIPAGATAMALYYDDSTGTLTPLTPIGQDQSSLTAGATHFSSFLGALVDLAKLPATADSGFRPGADDWQFTNYGSYVAPGGHCEGQSLSAIWYYVTQRRGAGASPLHGLYDNNGASDKTPTFQHDDSDGYRFASVVQHDPIAVPFTYNFLKNAMWDSADQRLTYAAFQAAIAFSGEPQLIRISPAPGDQGHTMIVYRVTPNWLLIADPNYPGRHRPIRYDAAAGTLAPYSSGANAADIAANGATIYTRFAYVPWRAASSAAAIAGHWAEFENGEAGDAVFPAYRLDVRPGDSTDDADWTELVNGYQTDANAVQLGSSMDFYVYRETTRIDDGHGRVPLQEGANELGFHVVGKVNNKWKYVDFVRYTIIKGPASSLTLTAGDAKYNWWDRDLFAGVEVQGAAQADGTVRLSASAQGIALTEEGFPGTGIGSFTLDGIYDPSTGQVSGSFTYAVSIVETYTDVPGRSTEQTLTGAGDVSGQIEGDVALINLIGDLRIQTKNVFPDGRTETSDSVAENDAINQVTFTVRH